MKSPEAASFDSNVAYVSAVSQIFEPRKLCCTFLLYCIGFKIGAKLLEHTCQRHISADAIVAVAELQRHWCFVTKRRSAEPVLRYADDSNIISATRTLQYSTTHNTLLYRLQ